MPLTLAALVGAGPLPTWAARALSEVAALPGIRVALIADPLRRHMNGASLPWASRLYVAADRWRFSPEPAIDVPSSSRAWLAAVPRATCTDDESFARLVREASVDAVIDLSGGRPGTSAQAPLGTWRLSHAGLSAEQAAVASQLGDAECVRSSLASIDDPGLVLAESVTGRDHVSVARTLHRLHWKSIALVRRGVQRLQRQMAAAGRPPDPHSRADPPAALETGGVLSRLPAYVARAERDRRARQRMTTRWALLLGRRDGGDIAGIQAVAPPPGRFWADPFIVAEGSRRYVFFEDYRDDLRRAHIAVAPLDDDLRLGPAVVALERPYHLSYPFVFRHEGAWFMIPETSENRTVEVYRCEAFPDRWRFSHVLMHGVRAVDATLLYHGERWWLFANVAELEGSSTHDELSAFWATDPLSTTWQPHPMNPLVADVRRARPAGPFIWRDGRLIRPSQDCSGEYGRAVCLNEVTALTETTYQEHPIGRYAATWDPRVVAIHTLSEHDGVVCLDGKLRRARADAGPLAVTNGRCTLSSPRTTGGATGS
jgi:hypothetical protein